LTANTFDALEHFLRSTPDVCCNGSTWMIEHLHKLTIHHDTQFMSYDQMKIDF